MRPLGAHLLLKKNDSKQSYFRPFKNNLKSEQSQHPGFGYALKI
jgi:hypothetical protein